jgi:hypothetical protein
MGKSTETIRPNGCQNRQESYKKIQQGVEKSKGLA